MAGWPVGVVEVGVHGRCTAAGAARRAWSTGWRYTENYGGLDGGFEWGHSSLSLNFNVCLFDRSTPTTRTRRVINIVS